MNDYQFSGQKENEEVIIVLRQHFWVFAIPILEIVLALLIYIIIFHFAGASAITSWATIIFLAFSLYIFTRAWFIWWNQVYLITNERALAVDQRGWFHKTVSEANIDNILFINHEVKGPIETLFNFGDVRIRASGVVEDELVFKNVADPYDIQQIIVRNQKSRPNHDGPVEEKEEENDKSGKVILR